MEEQSKYSKEFLLNYFDIKHPSDVRILSICYIIVINAFGIGSLAAAQSSINEGLSGGGWNYLLYSFLAISIWGIVIAIFPSKMKYQFFLFSGVASLAITVCFVTSYIIIVCFAYGLSPVMFSVIGIIPPLSSAIFHTVYRIRLFRKTVISKRGKPLYGIIAAFSMLGLGMGKVMFPSINERVEDLVFAFLLILMSCVFAALMELIYRYFLSLRYKKVLK